jgi:aryl-alcohol dehydrogenase-like predicted oxidoreductase
MTIGANTDPDFNEPDLSANLALVERLRAGRRTRMAAAPGAVAVAWTLRHPAVTGAIVGARKAEQVDDMIAAAGIQLTESDLMDIEASPNLPGGVNENRFHRSGHHGQPHGGKPAKARPLAGRL